MHKNFQVYKILHIAENKLANWNFLWVINKFCGVLFHVQLYYVLWQTSSTSDVCRKSRTYVLISGSPCYELFCSSGVSSIPIHLSCGGRQMTLVQTWSAKSAAVGSSFSVCNGDRGPFALLPSVLARFLILTDTIVMLNWRAEKFK